MPSPREDERLAIVAVLAAAAREAQELLDAARASDEVCLEALHEAGRRLKLFMRSTGRTF